MKWWHTTKKLHLTMFLTSNWWGHYLKNAFLSYLQENRTNTAHMSALFFLCLVSLVAHQFGRVEFRIFVLNFQLRLPEENINKYLKFDTSKSMAINDIGLLTLKKPCENIVFLIHIFAIPSSSRHEKLCQIFERLFVIFLHSINIPYYVVMIKAPQRRNQYIVFLPPWMT